MKFTQKQIVIIGGAVLLLVVIGVAIWFSIRPASQSQKVTLTVWGTDPKSVFDDLAAGYKTYTSSLVTVNYTQSDPANYSGQLLKALAAGTGPDVFEIGNRQLPQWTSVTAPIPASLAPSFNTTSLQNDFPSVVAQDFTAGGQIYALPLDLDTLIMFYNKDLFDTAHIVFPPKTWDEFGVDIPKLRVENMQGQLTQAAAALGGSEASIANAPDLVFLLMLQNGTMMTSNDGSSATFNSAGQSNNSGGQNTGLAAFNFYLQFSNAASPSYTWSDNMGDAVQSFIQGKTAILFDYASAITEIQQKAPFLHYGIAAMPQPANATIAVNYPRYKGLAAAKYGQSTAAWQFILYATTNSGAEATYTKDTGEPPATRAYIAANLNDPNYGVLASQALTARSWYEANDGEIDAAMNMAIENVLNGSMDSGKALGVAQDAVSSIMRGR